MPDGHAEVPEAKLAKMDTGKIEDVVNAFDDEIGKKHKGVAELQEESPASPELAQAGKQERDLEAGKDAIEEYQKKRVKAAEDQAEVITKKMHLSGGQVPPEMQALSPEMKHDVADIVHDKVVDKQDQEHELEQDMSDMQPGVARIHTSRKVD